MTYLIFYNSVVDAKTYLHGDIRNIVDSDDSGVDLGEERVSGVVKDQNNTDHELTLITLLENTSPDHAST